MREFSKITKLKKLTCTVAPSSRSGNDDIVVSSYSGEVIALSPVSCLTNVLGISSLDSWRSLGDLLPDSEVVSPEVGKKVVAFSSGKKVDVPSPDDELPLSFPGKDNSELCTRGGKVVTGPIF